MAFSLPPRKHAWVFSSQRLFPRSARDGVQVSGDRASKTLTLHRRIYAADPDAGCVIHTHSTHLVALTLAGVWKQEDILPPLTPYYVMKVGHVPLIEYYRPGDAIVGDLVRETIERMRAQATPIRAVMLDRSGPQCLAHYARSSHGCSRRAGRNRAALAACGAKAGAAHTQTDRSTTPAIWRVVVGV